MVEHDFVVVGFEVVRGRVVGIVEWVVVVLFAVVV